MEADAHIEVTDYHDIEGNIERQDWRWVGGEVAAINVMTVPRWLSPLPSNLSEGDVFMLGPFRLRVIEFAWLNTVAYVMQDGIRARVRYWLHRYTRPLDLIYRRTIITLTIWRLAEYSPARIPSYKDIYLVQKVTGWITHLAQMLSR